MYVSPRPCRAPPHPRPVVARRPAPSPPKRAAIEGADLAISRLVRQHLGPSPMIKTWCDNPCRRNGRKKLAALASIEIAKHTLMSGGLILAIGTITGLLAQKIKIPDVAAFLIVGMLIGPEAMGLINIKADSALNQIVLLFGASYILFDGGASLRFNVLKQVWITIVALATVGVIVTAAITGTAAYYVFGIPPVMALLLGATLASTDPATLVPIFQQVKIRDRVAQTVVSESAFNDATGAVATFGVLAVAMGTSDFSLAESLVSLIKQLAIGIVAG